MAESFASGKKVSVDYTFKEFYCEREGPIRDGA